MKKNVIVIQNDQTVGLGTLGKVLQAMNAEVIIYQSGKDDLSKIDPAAGDLLVILGGRMGVYEREKYPWLVTINQLLQKRIKADLPTMGLCLGGQLIAYALGAKVYKSNAQEEVGYFPLQLTSAGRAHDIAVFAKEGICVAESHGDVFDLPTDATLLASTKKNHNQAFEIGNMLALQFHPEVTASTFAKWMDRREQNAKDKGEIFDKSIPLQQMKRYAPAFELAATAFFEARLAKYLMLKQQDIHQLKPK